MLSTWTTGALSVFCVLVYVVPFYFIRLPPGFTTNDPFFRQSPTFIKPRIRSVICSTVVLLLGVYAYLVRGGSPLDGGLSTDEALRVMGLAGWRGQVYDAGRAVMLTMVLFAGPLFESVFVDEKWRALGDVGGCVRVAREAWGNWVFWKHVAAPITEELVFRSVIVTITITLASTPPLTASQIVFITPLYFGVAHINHIFETRRYEPHVPLVHLLLRALFQLTYTTIFGWYAAFIYLRTASVLACILVHAFCNVMGFPWVWGRVKRQTYAARNTVIRGGQRGDEEIVQERFMVVKDVHFMYSVLYYGLLVSGAYGFQRWLWAMTESQGALGGF